MAVFLGLLVELSSSMSGTPISYFDNIT